MRWDSHSSSPEDYTFLFLSPSRKCSVALLGYRKMNGDGMDKEKERENHMRQGGGEGDEQTKGTMHKKKEIIRSFGGYCVV